MPQTPPPLTLPLIDVVILHVVFTGHDCGVQYYSKQVSSRVKWDMAAGTHVGV